MGAPDYRAKVNYGVQEQTYQVNWVFALVKTSETEQVFFFRVSVPN